MQREAPGHVCVGGCRSDWGCAAVQWGPSVLPGLSQMKLSHCLLSPPLSNSTGVPSRCSGVHACVCMHVCVHASVHGGREAGVWVTGR